MSNDAEAMTEFDQRITQARRASSDLARQVRAHIEESRARRVDRLLGQEIERPVVPDGEDEAPGSEPFSEATGLA